MQDVIPAGTVVYTQLKNIQEKFGNDHYKLLWCFYVCILPIYVSISIIYASNTRTKT